MNMTTITDAPTFDMRPNVNILVQDIITGKKIHDQFLIACSKNPSAIAIRDSVGTLSYQQVDQFSQALTQLIGSKELSKNRIIAIYGKRSASLVISILSCSQANFTFVVIDSAYPNEKITQLTELIDPAFILGIDSTQDELAKIFIQFDHSDLITVSRESLQSLVEDNQHISHGELDSVTNDVAYLLFTSGTTGKPKCIKTSHSPLVHFVDFYKSTFNPEPGHRFSMISGLSHDPILRDIFVPLSVGAEINIPENEIIANGIKLFNWFEFSKITHTHLTPQMIRLLCAGAEGHKSLPDLRMLFSGGDVLRALHVNELRNVSPNVSIVNFYGTTETPQAMAYHVIEDNEDLNEIPIGKGIADVQILVLKENLSQSEIKELGEICIRTKYLSLGYLNDETLTSSCFVHSPFSDDSSDLLYRTGDYGYYREDGAVVIKGRMDDQVKIRGYRIELGEVVKAIQNESLVKNVAVLPQTLPNGENILVGYVVLNGTEQEDTSALLKTNISNKLPIYMVPSRFIYLDELPLLPNGKLDRNQLFQLSKIIEGNEETDELIDDNDDLNNLIKEFKKLLSLSKIDPKYSFIQLGGDSLSFIEASMVMEKKLGYLPENWEETPIQELIKHRKKDSKPFLHKIYSSVLVRAISIILVVLDHFKLLSISGSTDALFMVAGCSFGTYQLNTICQNNTVTPILKTVGKIFVPVFLYILLLQQVFSEFHWESAFLISNFISPYFDHALTYWFIEILVQIYLILALIFMIKPIRKLALNKPYLFGLAALIISIILGIVINHYWDTDYLYNRVPHMKLWIFFLGVTMVLADNYKKKLFLILFPAAFCFLGYFQIFALISMVFVLFIKRVSLPTVLAYCTNIIAASSLFIYLTHFQFHSLVKHALSQVNNEIGAIAAIIGGCIIWKVWEWVTIFALKPRSFFRKN